MARRKTGDKKVTRKEVDIPTVQADDHSIAFDQMHVGGNVSGDIRIGHTIGYTVEQVSVLLKQITTTLQPKKFDGRCPYKGLEVFEEEDAELFFGRERLVNELVGRVKESRTVFITGPSGSGKSSLVRAGLIHALKREAIKSSDRWLYETMKPGREPIKDLALAFSRLKSPELEDYFLAHAGETDILNKCAESVLSGRKDQRFVLFIDQFEEVFTQISGEEERVAFINMLSYAGTIENGRVIVLFAMRSDFVSNCATYPGLNELLSQEFRQIGAMQPEELVSAIALPARHVGLPVEDELIARIINDMKGEPDALPLMQFALKDLFDAKQAEGGVIALTLKDYLQHGGIQQSLERHADATFAELNQNEQELARSIFSGLIEIGRGTQDTKRTALFDELVPANTKPEEVGSIVQKLATARLIITDEQAGKDTVTISHEKLIDAWPWLKKLVNENRDVIALQNEIANDAKDWEDHHRDPSYLYTGARLANAREQLDAKNLVLSGTAYEFVYASIKAFDEEIEAAAQEQERKKRLQRRIITGLVSFTAVILVLLIFALIQLNMSRALQLGAQAQVAFAEQNYNAAALYAYQANQIHENNAADSVLGKLYSENFVTAKSLIEHVDSVTSVAWSADGRLASASNTGTIIVWDLSTGRPTQTIDSGQSFLTRVAWSADGRLTSVSEQDSSLIIWDLSTGQPAQILKREDSETDVSVAWSADGRLASGFASDGRILIWDFSTDSLLKPWRHPRLFNLTLAWSTDGSLASASDDNTIIIWDLSTRQPAQTLKGHVDAVTSLAWSADGQLASSSLDGSIILWDLAMGQPVQTLNAHAGEVNSVTWSADGRLASGSSDGSVILWDLSTGQPAQTLKGHVDAVTSVAWSADGQLASASYDGTIIVWNLSMESYAQTLNGSTPVIISSLSWSDDGVLASASGDGNLVLWDLPTGKPAQTIKEHGYLGSWSADDRLASVSGDGSIILWDLSTGEPVQMLKGHVDVVTSVAWSADGQLASASANSLASLSPHGTIILWDLIAGKPAQTIQESHSRVYSIAWSPDGRLAAALDDGTVKVWNFSKGQTIQILRGHKDIVLNVAWSKDGRLASASYDHTVILWDLSTGQPDQILKGHTDTVSRLAWSDHGQLASGSWDGTIILWDVSTGRPAHTLKGQGEEITSLTWSPDGRLAFGLNDGTVKILRKDLLQGKTCDWIFRNMTIQEWIEYQGLLYNYQPACPNLPYYAFSDPLLWSDFGVIAKFFTWQGRVILLGIALLILAVLVGIVRGSSKLISRFWRKISKRIRKKPRIA